jgi:hypothetical protein
LDSHKRARNTERVHKHTLKPPLHRRIGSWPNPAQGDLAADNMSSICYVGVLLLLLFLLLVLLQLYFRLVFLIYTLCYIIIIIIILDRRSESTVVTATAAVGEETI